MRESTRKEALHHRKEYEKENEKERLGGRQGPLVLDDRPLGERRKSKHGLLHINKEASTVVGS